MEGYSSQENLPRQPVLQEEEGHSLPFTSPWRGSAQSLP